MLNRWLRFPVILTFIFLFVNHAFTKTPEGIHLSRTSNGYKVIFNIPDYQMVPQIADGEEYNNLLMPSYGVNPDIGRAALPVISFNLFISNEEENPAVKILTNDTEEIIIQNKIYPFQKPWEKSKPISDRPFTIDRDYYNSPGIENFQTITVSDPFIIGGVKGVVVNIYPFNYNPVENNLTITTSITFEINLTHSPTPNQKKSKVFNDFLKNVFVNYDGPNSGGNSNYLIITDPTFESTLVQFVDYKNSIGCNVDLFSTNTAGTSKNEIKNFIQQRYDNPDTRPEFILLVGDVSSIPAWTGSGSGYPTTDMKYALLEGSDSFADAFIGRFSVSTDEQLQNVINKTIFMESNIGSLTKRNIFMASSDNWQISEGTHNDVIDNYFDPAGYVNTKLFTHSYSATTEQLKNELNSNQVFAIYSGHGSTTGWIDGPPFNQPYVRNLTNSWYPFVYSFACQTGAYSSSECFGETWLRAENGASTFYGSSVDSYWDEDDVLERKVFKSVFEDSIQTVSQSFFQGMIYLVNYYGGVNSTTLRYLEMYNLMGDPSMPVSGEVTSTITYPNPVNDLAAVNPTSSSITLTWTTPYDSVSGIITEYDIRYSITMINNDDDFNNSSQILLINQTDSTGTAKEHKIDGFNFNTEYFFAVKVKDELGNISAMSNVTQISTYFAPSVLINRDSVQVQIHQNSFCVDSIVISNVSLKQSTLDYSINMTALFSTGSDWMELSNYNGTIINGRSSVIYMNVNTESLDIGEYKFNMVITTNDPNRDEVVVPVTIIVIEEISLSVNNNLNIPVKFALDQNFPNPFNPNTTIRFALPISSKLVIGVYNSIGEKVAEAFNGELEAGYHQVDFNASSFPSGAYFYRFESEQFVSVKKMILMK